MDIKQIVNSRGGKGAAAAAAVANGAPHDMHMMHSMPMQTHQFPMSDAGSERGNSPHDSEHSRYSAPRLMTNNQNGMPQHFSSAAAMKQPLLMQQQQQQAYRPETAYDQNNMMQQQDPNRESPRPTSSAAMKAFPCSTCQKGFARRSDLARHERIHSGVRPHVCEHPGCNKQFIQRSALTVHTRVHTGEKPHMCERCGKPFSDSSSLARHRRIHSGKRPYKCPYADCQKTFTRRTTLTRHQNGHTGTVEEAAAATAAALASRGTGSQRTGRRSDGEQFSVTGSPMSTPSPGHRNDSASPNSDLVPMNTMRHPNDYQPYMNNSSVPVHLRTEYQIPGQASPATATYTNMMPRPTSHPTSYGPPSVLEPPAHNMDQRQQSASATSSPHMSSAGWQSPSHQNMPSPNSHNYAYPEPEYGVVNQHMYYPPSNTRRPQSTEPDHGYELKPRMNEMWTVAQ
ncbi:hypothetical protein BJ878DRAFT_543276 [Calycina marina]|uniref:C2H2-type domain-containing protein n=1 Tax=Calycina marina TaxID=1763456 RepID=A0A9P7Z133_9HELO|nr:hypothetical protein BJ878DRAFT_543276 [Calycina marina]